MTILRDSGRAALECEECSETTETFARDEFNEMIESAKDAGWEIRQGSNGEWEHRCPGCSGGGGGRLARARAMFGRH